MITAIIQNKLTDLTSDTSSVALLFFLAFLAAYFFIFVQPAISSNRRVKNKVRRMQENHKANEIFQRTIQKNEITKFSKSVSSVTPVKQQVNKSKPRRINNNYYKNDKGYNSFLKRNSKHHQNKKVVEHSRFARASGFLKKTSIASKPLRLNQGKFGVAFVGNLPLNRKPENPKNIGPTNSFTSGPSKPYIY